MAGFFINFPSHIVLIIINDSKITTENTVFFAK